MSNSAKLKKKAAEFEAKKQYDKALEVYEQALTAARAGDEERDVPLYNRVGDLHYRIGNTEQAMGYYEQAADLYAEGGFFNNAIALCNKILRYAPGRTLIYYKLGIISAKKGFNSDAKQNFLEYADRMQRAGQMDEAFRALKEFADLCPGQDDVRLMLADQLIRADRKTEALEQLALLYDMLEGDGRSAEANATLERMKALDPAFKPSRSATPVKSRKHDGLVFLDLEFTGVEPMPGGSANAGNADDSDQCADDATEGEVAVAPDASSVITPSAGQAASDAPEGLELTALADPSPAAGPDASGPGDLIFISEPEEAADEVGATDESEFLPLELEPMIEAPDEDPPAADDDTPLPSRPAIEFPLPDDLSIWSGSSDEEFIDLGDWLERNRTPVSTRMIAHDEEPEGDEQKDFAEMLDKFKAGVTRNVDDEDFGSHYDLGIAFREMGLLDEAIGSFQKASRGTNERVRACEAIGQCFMDKGEAAVTMTVLDKLLSDRSMSDSQLVGVLYLLGRAAESLGREADAASFYQRVLAVQIGFRDAAARLNSLAQTSR